MNGKPILQAVRQVARDALGQHKVEVYLFGSWAKGTQRRTSDIDIAVDPHEPLPPGLLAHLREQFEESHIPYFVEVVDLSETDKTFRAKVRREGKRWSV